MTVLLFGNYFAKSAEAGLGGFALALVVSGIGYFLAAVILPPTGKSYLALAVIGVGYALAAAAYRLAAGDPETLATAGSNLAP